MFKFLLLLLVIALIIYGCVMILQRQVSGPKKPRTQGPQRPLGPDDDPDFLRELNRRKRPKPPTKPGDH